MKTKNIILIGIILLTWYYPFMMIFSTLYVGISGLLRTDGGVDMMQMAPVILIIIIIFCVYVLGILTINLGLKKLIKSEK